jgi:TBC domain-containing protein kinase-like protein
MQSDVWALGMIVLEWLTGESFWIDGRDIFTCDMATVTERTNVLLETITHGILVDFIRQCLTFDANQRPSPTTLLRHPLFSDINPPTSRTKQSLIDRISATHESMATPSVEHPLNGLPLAQVYYLWRLAGGDLEATLARHGAAITTPPIDCLPHVATADGLDFGSTNAWASVYSDRVFELSMHHLESRLGDFLLHETVPVFDGGVDLASAQHMNGVQFVDVEALLTPLQPVSLQQSPVPLQSAALDTTLEPRDFMATPRVYFEKYQAVLQSMVQLPLAIRERDVAYQYVRLHLFTQLLLHYPASHRDLVREANIDIPPLLRGPIWACLLGVRGDITESFDALDTFTESSTDRQLDVDIPRCHQYHPLLRSPDGHQKLRRLLQAWLVANPNLVYWQGTLFIQRRC